MCRVLLLMRGGGFLMRGAIIFMRTAMDGTSIWGWRNSAGWIKRYKRSCDFELSLVSSAESPYSTLHLGEQGFAIRFRLAVVIR